MEAASSISKPSREELLARCRRAGAYARARGTPKKRPTAKARKQAAAAVTQIAGTENNEAAVAALEQQLRTEEFTLDQLKQLSELEKELFETCNGDAAAFCRMKGVSEDTIPMITAAVESVKAGNPLPESLKDLMRKVK